MKRVIKCWVAKDKDGGLYSYEDKPVRMISFWLGENAAPIKSILLQRIVEWEDEPKQITITVED